MYRPATKEKDVALSIRLLVNDIDVRYSKSELLSGADDVLDVRRALCKVLKDWIATTQEWAAWEIEEF